MPKQDPESLQGRSWRDSLAGRRAIRKPLLAARRILTGNNTPHEFASGAPSAQQTVDIFAGEWITAFPEKLEVQAGWVNHFDPEVDPRVSWANGIIPGGITGKSVLEIGPFEAYQTALLEWAGAASVTAVEGSRSAYLKCLVVKELLGLKAQILYGDAHEYLETCPDQFDIIWASGILYHQTDPIGFLTKAAALGDHLFLHTHYFDDQKVAATRAAWRFVADKNRIVKWHGRDIQLHYYDYESGNTSSTFAGGPHSFTNWLTREDIEFILSELGFESITYGVLDPDNDAGPAFFLLASRL
jgi:protein-L-isoaspartate O-methyltransferase